MAGMGGKLPLANTSANLWTSACFGELNIGMAQSHCSGGIVSANVDAHRPAKRGRNCTLVVWSNGSRQFHQRETVQAAKFSTSQERRPVTRLTVDFPPWTEAASCDFPIRWDAADSDNSNAPGL
jgi:hypothetical protein